MSKEAGIRLGSTIIFGVAAIAISMGSDGLTLPATVLWALTAIAAIWTAVWAWRQKPPSSRTPDEWVSLAARFTTLAPSTELASDRLGAILENGRWLVVGSAEGRQEEFKSVAASAAAALFAFPAIVARLSAEVKNAPEGYGRWLYFLKQQGELQNPEDTFYTDGPKSKGGHIPHVAAVSARQCHTCRSWIP